jgi:hypothetical protein
VLLVVIIEADIWENIQEGNAPISKKQINVYLNVILLSNVDVWRGNITFFFQLFERLDS